PPPLPTPSLLSCPFFCLTHTHTHTHVFYEEYALCYTHTHTRVFYEEYALCYTHTHTHTHTQRERGHSHDSLHLIHLLGALHKMTLNASLQYGMAAASPGR